MNTKKREPYFKTLQMLLLLVLHGLFSPCQGAESEQVDIQPMASVANKSILVTFVDRTITRRPIATLRGAYRHTRSYTSSTWSRNVAARLAKDYRLRRISEWPITEIGVQCVVYEITDDRSVDDVLAILANDEQVESVQRMRIFHMFAAISGYKDPYYKLQANMHDLRLYDIHRLTTGKNVRIALIDTGVDFRHPDLKGQTSPANNFTTAFSKTFSDNVHGTAVAGIIAARANNDIGIVGVAPDARVIALKACWSSKQDSHQASCNSLTLALAINRAIKMDVDILNLSLGGPPDPLVGRLINAAIARDITVIAADPGIDSAGQHFRFPASMEAVIAVRSTLQPGRESESSIQNHSISAPGLGILTTIPQASYGFMSGCSFAAAHVSGIVALLLEINPDFTPREIFDLLDTASKQPVIGSSAGEIDVLATLYKLRGQPLLSRTNNQSLATW